MVTRTNSLRRGRSRRAPPLAALAVATAASLGTLVATDAARAQDEEPKAGGTLVMVDTQVPRHFNGAVQSGTATMQPAAQIFAFLVRADADWNIEPYLAESWEVAEDGLSVTFRLREGATFHDGEPITSEDVAFSIETQQANHPFKTSLGAVESVETPDPLTAVVKLSAPHPALFVAMSTAIVPIIPKHVYGDGQDVKSHPRNTENVVGSGPFELQEYAQGEYYILTKNEDFFLEDRPYLDRIVMRISKDSSNAVLAMENGEANLYAFMPNVSEIARLKENEDLEVTNDGYEGIGPNNWLAFNTERPPLDDVRVRQAIGYAIDRDFITEALHRGTSVPSTEPVVPGSPFYSDAVETYDVDLERAEALLDEAGLEPDGNGTRASLTIDYLPGAPDVQQRIAEYLRPQLKKIGLDVEVRNSPDFPTWANRISNWDFDMTMDLVFNWGDPVIGVHRTYLCDNAIKGVIWSNTQQYCNERVDELFGEAGRELDEAKRKALYAEAHRILADELPVYWINVMPYHTAYSKTVRNPPRTVWATISPMDEVWLDE